MALNDTQIDQLTVYVRDNPDAIVEFDSTPTITPNNGWAIADTDTVVEVMNEQGKVAGQTLDRECLPSREAQYAVEETEYQLLADWQRDLWSLILSIHAEIGGSPGIPLDNTDVNQQVKAIFPNGTGTLTNLIAKRTRNASPAENLYNEEDITVTREDAQKARP